MCIRDRTIAVNSTERAFIILQILEAMDVKFINGKTVLEDMRIIKDEDCLLYTSQLLLLCMLRE